MTFDAGFDKREFMETNPNSIHSEELAQRKGAHIELASRAQTPESILDSRFDYEPLFFAHPKADDKLTTKFLGFTLDYPVWVSSMTGGTAFARTINQNLARLCAEYKLGMGLGSCRSLLEGDDRLEDFKVKHLMEGQPLLANLGLAQVEELVMSGHVQRIHEMVRKVEADGLIIHLNPLQEWFQPEGDRYRFSPLETLKKFFESCTYPVIVKEVGHGMGPRSLKALIELPLAGIEFGAFGGTNFSLLENMRGTASGEKDPFINVGHSAREMVAFVNALPKHDKEFIISGGVRSALNAHELLETIKAPAVIGMAHPFLGPALAGEAQLNSYFAGYREALLMARGLLRTKGEK